MGCGTIGRALAQAIVRRWPRQAALVALHDADPAQAARLRRLLKRRLPIVPLRALVRRSQLVIEAASASVSGQVVAEAIRAKRDCLVMSVGGLLKAPELFRRARGAGCRIYLPSGALAGLDAVRAARLGTIERVTLTTRKPPRALEGAPAVIRRRMALDRMTRETIIFEGGVAEAVAGFPQNINVAAALALACGRPERVRVRILATPGSTKNVHEVELVGSCGRIWTRTENRPSAANPKTSELAILSAIATLESIVVG